MQVAKRRLACLDWGDRAKNLYLSQRNETAGFGTGRNTRSQVPVSQKGSAVSKEGAQKCRGDEPSADS